MLTTLSWIYLKNDMHFSFTLLGGVVITSVKMTNKFSKEQGIVFVIQCFIIKTYF